MEGDLTQEEMLASITEWLAAGAALDKPKIKDGWFCVQDIIDNGMTEFVARRQVQKRYEAGELERKKYQRTWYYKKV